jgi:hypothetical protein
MSDGPRDVVAGSGSHATVLGLAAEGAADVLALRMLGRLLVPTPWTLDVRETSVLAGDLVDAVKRGHYRAVCIADLPPSAPSRARAVTRRLRALAPDLPILVGRWAPPDLADDSQEPLRAAGATHVATTLCDTRAELLRMTSETPAAASPDAA